MPFPDLERVEHLVAQGDLDGALAAILSRPMKGRRRRHPLNSRNDPRQDLLFCDGHWRSPENLQSDARALALAQKFRNRHPDSPLLEALSGALQLYTGDIRQAASALDRAIARAPEHDWLYIWRFAARMLLARRRKSLLGLRDALSDLDQALTINPGNIDALALRAEIRHDRELYGGALADLGRILSLDPDRSWAYAERGEILTELGRHREALEDFDFLVRRWPKQAWPYALRGRAFANGGKLAQSLPDFDKALSLEPRWGVALAWRGEARRKLGDLTGALMDFDRGLRLDPRFTLGYGWRGHAHLTQGRLTLALADLNRALKTDSRHAIFYPWRCEALAKSGRFQQALRDMDSMFPFQASLSWTPNPPLTRERTLFEFVDRAVADRPSSSWRMFFRARILLESSRQSEAVGELESAVNLSPRNGAPRAWLAEAYRRQGRIEAALTQARQAVRLSPNYAFARLWLGCAFLDARAPLDAAEQLTAAAAIAPDLALAYETRAKASLALGRSRRAAGDFETALFLQPKNPRLEIWLKKTREFDAKQKAVRENADA